MGCISSKTDINDLHPNVFHVMNVNEEGHCLSSGQLEITEADIIFYQKGKVPMKWPLKCLRRYGFDAELFSFESGRRCPTGPGIYAFNCRRAEQLFNMLQCHIQHCHNGASGEDAVSREFPAVGMSSVPSIPSSGLLMSTSISRTGFPGNGVVSGVNDNHGAGMDNGNYLEPQNASSCPIPVLAIGREALPAHRLMLHASTLAFRNVLHSIQQPITGKTRYQDEDKDGSSIWFDAGSLILAQGGICYLGEWGRHKQKTASEVLSVIEKKQITLASDRKVSAASLSFPLQSAIWTYSNINKKEKLLPLLSVFGIPFIADIDSEAEDEATKIILQNSRKSVKQEKSDPWDAELKMFLQISANNKVTLDPESAQLIQDYFVASRRCRKISNPEECLPVGAIDILLTTI